MSREEVWREAGNKFVNALDESFAVERNHRFLDPISVHQMRYRCPVLFEILERLAEREFQQNPLLGLPNRWCHRKHLINERPIGFAQGAASHEIIVRAPL